jgi:UDP-N-acetylmuramoyl-tripeptide--D-alanyl-D-alanine ligase
MYELGDNEGEYHYRIGEYARDLNISSLMLYGDCAENYIDGFYNGIRLDSKKSIAKYILDNFNEKDAILVKAGRKDKLEEIINELKELENEIY